MLVQPQTSFIPRKTPTAFPAASGVGGRFNVLAILAFLVFLASVGFAAFAFFYKSHLVKTIAELDASLVLARKSFDPEFIAEASRLDARIEGARTLLGTHRALSPLFDLLEKKTLENVRFQDFNFNAQDGNEVIVGMAGEAKSFNAVALQSDVFGAERSFKNPVFSNFSLNEQGDVIFDFQAVVDSKLLSYSETLLAAKGVAEDTEAETFDASGTVPSGDSP